MPEPDDIKWHLDKKVPIVIIITMMFQFAGGLWFISKLDARILALETSQAQQRDRDDRQDRSSETAVGLVRGDLQELSRKMDRLLERSR